MCRATNKNSKFNLIKDTEQIRCHRQVSATKVKLKSQIDFDATIDSSA